MTTSTQFQTDFQASNAPGLRASSGSTAMSQSDPARQAYHMLHVGFVAAPVLAGADKFFNLMTQWEKYLAPQIASLVPVSPHTFMEGVGVVEVVAGALVAVKPRIGGYVVGAWLAGIIGNLALRGGAWDIALRDLGLMLGAFALARLATVVPPKRIQAP